VNKQYEKTDILTPLPMKTRVLWNKTPSSLTNKHNFNYLHFQTTLPPIPDGVTFRDAGIYCVGQMNCVPSRVLG